MDARTARSLEVTFPSGEERPALGLGTWRMGEDAGQRAAEVRALRLALDIGCTATAAPNACSAWR